MTGSIPSELRGWRKSSFSGDSGCVELARTGGEQVAIRDSKAPDAGTIVISQLLFGLLLGAAKGGELDHLG